MSLVEINWNPEKTELRKFGLIAVIFLGTAGLILKFVIGAGTTWAVGVALAGLLIFIITLISAKAAKIIYLAMTLAAFPIGFVVSIVLMGTFYFLILTPVGLVFKLIGRDPLVRKFEPDSSTYWIPRKHTEDPERYFHQS